MLDHGPTTRQCDRCAGPCLVLKPTVGCCLLCGDQCFGEHAKLIKAAIDITTRRGLRIKVDRTGHARYLAGLLLCLKEQGASTDRLLEALTQPEYGGLTRPTYHDTVKLLEAPDAILISAAAQLKSLLPFQLSR